MIPSIHYLPFFTNFHVKHTSCLLYKQSTEIKQAFKFELYFILFRSKLMGYYSTLYTITTLEFPIQLAFTKKGSKQ